MAIATAGPVSGTHGEVHSMRRHVMSRALLGCMSPVPSVCCYLVDPSNVLVMFPFLVFSTILLSVAYNGTRRRMEHIMFTTLSDGDAAASEGIMGAWSTFTGASLVTLAAMGGSCGILFVHHDLGWFRPLVYLAGLLSVVAVGAQVLWSTLLVMRCLRFTSAWR